MKTVIFKICLLAGLVFFSCQFANAQKRTAQRSSAIPALPVCDKILSEAKAEMQKQADATCKSVTRCVPCNDTRLNHNLYVTLVVNPIAAKCMPAKAQASGAVQAERAPPAAAVAPAANEILPENPVFEIRQAVCENGAGVDLDVFIPGNAMQCSKDQYSFLWEIDGGKGGHSSTINCACGKTAQLTVTEIKTGRSLTKEVTLLPCGKQ